MKRKLALLLLLILLLTLSVQAAPALNHVTDEAGLLSESERAELEALCQSVSQGYGCGVYIVTVDDFRDYGSGDVFEVTYGIYHQYELGEGTGRDGTILLLSMAERDYALFVYGDQAEYAMDSYGQIVLEEEFLPHFGENDWFDGFWAYVTTCDTLLAKAAAGDPVRASAWPAIGIATVICFGVAFVVCAILKRGMKSVRVGTSAAAYKSGNLDLTRRYDQFTHKTTTRTKVQSSSGSSSSRSGGGGSGRSGKF